MAVFLPCHRLIKIWKHISFNPEPSSSYAMGLVVLVGLLPAELQGLVRRLCWEPALPARPPSRPQSQWGFLPPSLIPEPRLHGSSSCRGFFKPLCNLSFAGSIDKTFCCLFFDPSVADTFKLHLTQKFLSAKQTSGR